MTTDYLLTGGDGYDTLTAHATDVTELSGGSFDAIESFLRDTPLIYQGLPSSFGASSPALSLFAQSSTELYKACDVTSPLGLSNVSLPMRRTVCNSASVGDTPTTYHETPYDVSIAVVAQSTNELAAALASITAINDDRSVMRDTELCFVLINASSISTTALYPEELSAITCASNRSVKSGIVAAVLRPDAVVDLSTLSMPTVLFDSLDSAYRSSVDYPFVVTASPSNVDYSDALIAILEYFNWYSAHVLYTAEFSDLVTNAKSASLRIDFTVSRIQSDNGTSGLSAISEHESSSIILVFADDKDTTSVLTAATTAGYTTGFAYIVVSQIGALAMNGALVLHDKFSAVDYVQDAVFSTAYGIDRFLSDWSSASLVDEFADVRSALADPLLLHAYFASSTFQSDVTGTVDFTTTGSRVGNTLVVGAIDSEQRIRVGSWSKDTGLIIESIAVWPGGASSYPITNCEPGYAPQAGACVACPAGYFSDSVSAGCEPCGRGQYNPQHGMSACLDCETAKVAPSLASEQCKRCPRGAKCPKSKKVIVLAGYWTTGSPDSEVHECPLKQYGCPGGNFSDSVRCHIGFKGPLCATCEQGYYASMRGTGGVGTCRKCGNRSTALFTVLLILLIVVLVLAVATHFKVLHTGMVQQAQLSNMRRKFVSLSLDAPMCKVVFSAYQIISSVTWCVVRDGGGSWLLVRVAAHSHNLSPPVYAHVWYQGARDALPRTVCVISLIHRSNRGAFDCTAPSAELLR